MLNCVEMAVPDQLPLACLKEIAMAKAKKHVATRKKSSKRSKANAKPARKLARATARNAKSKVKRTAVNAKRPPAKKRRPLQRMETPKPIETTPMDVIDEPAPGVAAVTEHESTQIATSISTDVQPEHGEELSPAGTSP